MPVYEYHCSACGHRTDIIRGINDDGPRFCPACGAEGTMRKTFAPPTIVFKGSGWAKKERHAARTARKSAASGDSDSSGSGSASTSDTKPADAGESKPPKPAASSGAD